MKQLTQPAFVNDQLCSGRRLAGACIVFLLVASGCSSSSSPNVNTAKSLELNVAAASALKTSRADDAGFYFFAAQIRYAIDKEVFPPAEKGGNSPGILKAALSASVGPAVLDALAKDSDGYAKVAARLAAWTPSVSVGYDPGWKYEKRVDEASAAAIVKSNLNSVLVTVRAKASLFEDAEYCQLSDQLQKLNQQIREFLDAEGAASRAKQRQKQDQLVSERETITQKRNKIAAQLKTIEWRLIPDWRWHAVVGWKAEDYFDDPQVRALCGAIERNDIEELERLIESGVNVNSLGKDGMSLLLWAFPDRKIERFECLLHHGADPNVIFESDFGVPPSRPFHPYPHGGQHFEDRGCHAGQSVTFLAARSPMLGYLKAVLAHGGDANIVDKKTKEAPLDLAASRFTLDGPERVSLLVSHGADMERYCQYRQGYPLMLAVKDGRYETALSLLKLGADPTHFPPDDFLNAVMVVARQERRRSEDQARGFAGSRPGLDELIEWLEKNFGSLDAAREREKEIQQRLSAAVRLSPKHVGKVRQEILAEQASRNERPPTPEEPEQ